MPTGVAIGLSTVAAGAIGASAAKSAGKTQAESANRATDIQQQMFNQTRGDLAPYMNYGGGSLPALNRLLGLDASGAAIESPKVGDVNIGAWEKANPDVRSYYDKTPEAQQAFSNYDDFARSISVQQKDVRGAAPTYSANDVADWRSPTAQALEALPGYKFMRDQGIQSVNRSLGSMGQTGAQAKGIARFVTGLADQTYGEQVNRLMGVASLGENAAAGAGNIGANYAGGISNTITGAGAAQAAGTVGAANAIGGAASSIPSYLLASKFLGGGSGGGGGGMYSSILNSGPGGIT